MGTRGRAFRRYPGGMSTDIWTAVRWDAPGILDPSRAEEAAKYLVTYFADLPGHTCPGYTGAMFTELGGGGDRPEVAHAVTAEDIIAVSTLSVDIDVMHALQLTGAVASEVGDARTAIERGDARLQNARSVPIDAVEIGRLLAQLPTDLDLVDATDADLAVTDRLWAEIRRKNLGPTRASKLLARKRPRLCPVIDSFVTAQLGHGQGRTDFFRSLRSVLQDADLGLPAHLGVLREAAVAAARSGSPEVLTDSGLVPGLQAAERIGRLSDLRVLDIVLWMAESARRRS